MTKETTLVEKIKLTRAQVQMQEALTAIYTDKTLRPQFISDYQSGDEKFLSDEKLNEYHKQLENHLIALRKFLESEKKGFEGFRKAWKTDDMTNAYVKKIFNVAPLPDLIGLNPQEPPRAKNKLYHPEINYDKDPMPQVYALLRADKWDLPGDQEYPQAS